VPVRLPRRFRGVPAPRAAAAALIVLSLAVAALRLPDELADQSRQAAPAGRIAKVGDVPVLPGVGLPATRLLAQVRRAVPPDEPVRIVQPATATVSALESRRQGTPGVCGYQTVRLRYFWVVYAIYPRPSTCDAGARWTLYYGVLPPPQSATATVYRTAADLVLVGR
jgi:hypothetical protein